MSKEKEQVINTIDSLQNVIDLFYQQSDGQAIDDLVGTIDEMSMAIDNLAVYSSKKDDFELDEAKVCNILKESMDAFQEKDYVLMADILQYDFIEYVNELVEKME